MTTSKTASSESGIPAGLHRIKTRREATNERSRLSSKRDDLEDRSESSRLSPAPEMKSARSVVDRDKRVKFSGFARSGSQKGKKIGKWITQLAKESCSSFNNVCPENKGNISGAKTVGGNSLVKIRARNEVVDNMVSPDRTCSPDSATSHKASKAFKSFSHELGRGYGISPPQSRAHSFDDLEELLGSLQLKFYEAKEVVDVELASFVADIACYLEKNTSSLADQEMAKKLLVHAKECMGMSCEEFRGKCEGIVHELNQEEGTFSSMAVEVALFFTRILFILTRCTRLLLLQKDASPFGKKAYLKFRKCLESIPTIDRSTDSEISRSIIDHSMIQKDAKSDIKEQIGITSFPHLSSSRLEKSVLEKCLTFEKVPEVFDQTPYCVEDEVDVSPKVEQFGQIEGVPTMKSMDSTGYVPQHEVEKSPNESDDVICRICEQLVPASHLECHSYICAHVDKCDMTGSSIEECLSKLAELLQQIIESRDDYADTPFSGPERSRLEPGNFESVSQGCSPRLSEWQNKGIEGMFEDLHEMDTASIDDSPRMTFIPMKGPFSVKLGSLGPPSSTGSMASGSSTSTPRVAHFDLFWLDRYNPSCVEDINQLVSLVDIARSLAARDLSEEGSREHLVSCMQDLLEILQQKKQRALLVDTFGGKIEKLLQEKYMLLSELAGPRNPEDDQIPGRSMPDEASVSSTMSTPLHPSSKERTRIDDFEIIKPISRGAFGKVFLARKRTTGDIFAIKVLKKLDMIRKNDVERILAERNILIAARNPFVVRFYYSFTSRDNLYLVMEYLSGGDLYSLLRKVGCLDEDVARIYIAELVLALEYLHSLGSVHRDLKPDNILIAPNGHIKARSSSTGFIYPFYLTDFGLSKIGLMNSTSNLYVAEDESNSSLNAQTQNVNQTRDKSRRSAVGTPDYLAPEILLGSDHGYAADWWSVGVILFELITGVPPFTAETPEIIFHNILYKKVLWPSIPSQMSLEAQDLINRFLEHDPCERLGAKGTSEVKEHQFFKGIEWDTLSSQKAAFVPQPEGLDDTSYFVSRWDQSSKLSDDQISIGGSNTSSSCSDIGAEIDGCGELADFSSPLDLSTINFSFKNLSQLASINHDVLVRTVKDPTKTLPPSRALQSQ
ncbi:putative serine/threonine protein kinase IRE4 [Drosera capensis]